MGDFFRLQARRGHLVEQRLEGVVVLAVDQHHFDGVTAQRPRQGQPAKAGTHDHHPGTILRHKLHEFFVAEPYYQKQKFSWLEVSPRGEALQDLFAGSRIFERSVFR